MFNIASHNFFILSSLMCVCVFAYVHACVQLGHHFHQGLDHRSMRWDNEFQGQNPTKCFIPEVFRA